MMDWLPTFAMLLGAELPRPVDGREIVSLFFDGKSPHAAFYYYSGDELHAVRSGKWKLHFPHDYLTAAAEPGKGGKPSNFGKLAPAAIEQSGIRGIASRHGYRVEKLGLSLFDLENDVGESQNVAAEHPKIVEGLKKLAENARADLGDSLTKRQGAHRRPAGDVRAE
jgi:arylsulfatase